MAASNPLKRDATRRRWYKLALAAIGLLLGVGLLAVVELALRVAGVSEPDPFFMEGPEVEGQGRLHFRGNAWASRFFFAKVDGRRLAPGSSVAEAFFSPKGPDEYRVAIVGESTVQGYPYPYNLSISKYVEALLDDCLPGQEVTVFNFGFTAVASYPVSRVVDEIAEVPELDAVVVLAGHNEFFGAYGVASSQYAGSSRRLMRLHEMGNQLRTVRFARQLLDSTPEEDSQQRSQGLIRVMAAADSIAPDDPRRGHAVRLLAANLEHSAEVCRRRGIPMFMGTMPSNLADFAPVGFSSAARSDTDSRLGDALALPESERLSAVLSILEGERSHALLWFRAGQLLEAAGRTDEAREAYLNARNLDGMPWRAPSATNDAIRETASRLGVPLIDCEAAFAQATKRPAPGWDFFDDHVHPSRIGRMLYARTIVKALLDSMDKEDALAMLRADDDYQRELGGQHLLSTREAIGRATSLMETPPIDRNNEAAVAYFRERLASMEKLMEPEEMEAWLTYSELAKKNEMNTSAALLAGKLFMQHEKLPQAIYQFQIARRSRPMFSLDFVQAGWLEAHCRHIGASPIPDELRRDLDKALMVIDVFPRLQPGDVSELLYSKGQILWVLQRYDEAIAALREGIEAAPTDRKPQFENSIAAIEEQKAIDSAIPPAPHSTRLNIE